MQNDPLSPAEPQPGFTTREPITVSSIVALIMSILAVAVSFGWLDILPDQMDQLRQMLVLLIPVIWVIANWWSRRKVTPVAYPRNNDGVELVPKA